LESSSAAAAVPAGARPPMTYAAWEPPASRECSIPLAYCCLVICATLHTPAPRPHGLTLASRPR